MTLVNASMISIYVAGLIIGSLFGVFAGIISLVAIIFATKYFKYARNNNESDDTVVA